MDVSVVVVSLPGDCAGEVEEKGEIDGLLSSLPCVSVLLTLGTGSPVAVVVVVVAADLELVLTIPDLTDLSSGSGLPAADS